ncbi:hypothetical protein AX15_002812 [Amanita polypyramis BW_CC]|nr:hypothetical protein AX15_002812 [Amanita polypyramis BW_CC]
MAGLEGLTSIIYHEKQQQGSALCAQHALNNLLQGSYFSAPDLSDIARNLDLLERSFRGGSGGGNSSTNMDDTGFFSVQVMENALKVWGLDLVRWRSEEMTPYHDRPHAQLAFVLNLEQHWFTLRRFGKAEPSADRDPGDGHWFNLNSFLNSPEWVGKLYLGMVLEQAEADGYSAFAVVQADPSAPLALPRTDGDVIAETLPEPNGASRSSAARTSRDDKDTSEMSEEFEEEDFELQAALQASLTGYEHQGHHNREESTVHSPLSYDSGSNTRGNSSQSPRFENSDPITLSMERNRLMLQHMREQQEYAQREAWSYTTEGMTAEQIVAHEARREEQRRREEEEQENLRRAIAESEAIVGHNGPTSDDVAHAPPVEQNRTYDDDDADFQAALQASLEQANGIHTSNHNQITEAYRTQNSEICRDQSSILSDGSSSSNPPLSPEIPSIEEMRRKRLAKFGG